MTDLWLSSVFFQALNISKLVFRPGPRWEIYDAPPDLLVSWGEGVPIRFPPRRLQRLDLGAFGASFVRSQTQIPGNAHD